MEGERVIDKLRRGEKVKCPVCNKNYYDVSSKNTTSCNYFHCENPDCKGYVHEQIKIDID